MHAALATTLAISPLFGSGAVFQSGQPVRITGEAPANAPVEIRFAGHESRISADATGRWESVLPPLDPGGPFLLDVSSGGESISNGDLYVGEVWLAAGQSNMALPLNESADESDPWESAGSSGPPIRVFRCRLTRSDNPAREVHGNWTDSLNKSFADQCGAVPAHFARHIRKTLGVPVGIIQNAWGGSAAEPWIPAHAFERAPELQAFRKERGAALNLSNERLRTFRDAMEAWYRDNPDIPAGRNTPAEMDGVLRPEGWKEVQKPFLRAGLPPPGDEGSVWFRTFCAAPPSAPGGIVFLDLGVIDAQVEVFVNRFPVFQRDDGLPAFWMQPVAAILPPELLTSRPVEILVRCNYRFCGGNDYRSRPPLLAAADGGRIVLDRWEGKPGIGLPAPDMRKPGRTPRPWPDFQLPWDLNAPAQMFNGLVAPLAGIGLRGVIWYQGESNAGRAEHYAGTLACLIEEWRKTIGRPVPFGIVQIAGFGSRSCPNPKSGSAQLRAAQAAVAESVPDVGLVTALHLGSPTDIHPKNKAPVGLMLAGWALEKVYNQPDPGKPWDPARVVRTRVDDRQVLITFNRPVQIRDNLPSGFGLAGADGIEHPADAVQENGVTLRVSCALVTEPRLVSLDWANCPPCHVRDRHGLPPLPFRLKLVKNTE